jgi:transposase-like protein
MDNANVVDFPSPETSIDPLNELLRNGARQLIEQAVQAELQVLLDVTSERRMADGRAAVVRSGYQPEREVQTGIGPVTIKIPKVRARDGDPVSFHSALVPPYVRKSASLAAAIPWLYLKGVSGGEMEGALKALVGPSASGLSAASVSRLKRQWGDEYKQWRQTLLEKDQWVYVWADGIYSGLRNSEDKLCALVLIGVNERGEKHFLAIEDGVRESAQSWREVLIQLQGRGMKAPKLAIGDGAMGFWAAVEELWPQTKCQRCLMHKQNNVMNYLPKRAQPKAKEQFKQIWHAESKTDAEKELDTFVKMYEAKHPKATACIVKDREEMLAFFDFPAEHWQSIRTTNPIESSFATIRHRTKRSKGCLSRDTMLEMMFKLGQCAEKNWRRLRGFNHLAKVITGLKFKDGIEQESTTESTDRSAA